MFLQATFSGEIFGNEFVRTLHQQISTVKYYWTVYAYFKRIVRNVLKHTINHQQIFQVDAPQNALRQKCCMKMVSYSTSNSLLIIWHAFNRCFDLLNFLLILSHDSFVEINLRIYLHQNVIEKSIMCPKLNHVKIKTRSQAFLFHSRWMCNQISSKLTHIFLPIFYWIIGDFVCVCLFNKFYYIKKKTLITVQKWKVHWTIWKALTMNLLNVCQLNVRTVQWKSMKMVSYALSKPITKTHSRYAKTPYTRLHQNSKQKKNIIRFVWRFFIIYAWNKGFESVLNSHYTFFLSFVALEWNFSGYISIAFVQNVAFLSYILSHCRTRHVHFYCTFFASIFPFVVKSFYINFFFLSWCHFFIDRL